MAAASDAAEQQRERSALDRFVRAGAPGVRYRAAGCLLADPAPTGRRVATELCPEATSRSVPARIEQAAARLVERLGMRPS